MKKFNFTIKGNKYHTWIKEIEGNIAKIEVNGTPFEVEMEKEVNKPSKTPTLVRKPVVSKPGEGAIPKGSGVGAVKAPLPGNIFKILVKEGDEVKSGDTLLIMEAMKMENDIKAEKSGTISAIKVSEGDAVLQGAVLVEFKMS